ncbi:MAG: hypothetical protein QOF28_38, partial [Actinomycetota bacterium]|nr:hypothetical protein [Actinomycetota bacterium]
ITSGAEVIGELNNTCIPGIAPLAP